MLISALMHRSAAHAVLLLALVVPGHAQAPEPSHETPPASPAFTTSTTLVLVPALVEAPAGDLSLLLKSGDFRLTDNGVPQHVSLESTEGQPLAILILMQTGGAAPRQFRNYAGLATMIDYLSGTAPHRVALLTFDSQPEDNWDFTPSIASLEEAFLHPTPGDGGAAIRDAISAGLDLFRTQPRNARRLILLLSQPQDDGSKAHVADLIRKVAESNTTIYSLTFSPQKTQLKEAFSQPTHGNPPYQLSPAGPTVINTIDYGAALKLAYGAMRENSASELAALSGGEYLRFDDRRGLEQQLSLLANHIPNRFILSFHPTSSRPGLHTLTVQIPSQPTLTIAARTAYWAGP